MIAFFLSNKKWLHFFHNDWIFLQKKWLDFFYKKKTFEISSAKQSDCIFLSQNWRNVFTAKNVFFSCWTQNDWIFLCQIRNHWFFFCQNKNDIPFGRRWFQSAKNDKVFLIKICLFFFFISFTGDAVKPKHIFTHISRPKDLSTKLTESLYIHIKK